MSDGSINDAVPTRVASDQEAFLRGAPDVCSSDKQRVLSVNLEELWKNYIWSVWDVNEANHAGESEQRAAAEPKPSLCGYRGKA